jgi:hypothetical protein
MTQVNALTALDMIDRGEVVLVDEGNREYLERFDRPPRPLTQRSRHLRHELRESLAHIHLTLTVLLMVLAGFSLVHPLTAPGADWETVEGRVIGRGRDGDDYTLVYEYSPRETDELYTDTRDVRRSTFESTEQGAPLMVRYNTGSFGTSYPANDDSARQEVLQLAARFRAIALLVALFSPLSLLAVWHSLRRKADDQPFLNRLVSYPIFLLMIVLTGVFTFFYLVPTLSTLRLERRTRRIEREARWLVVGRLIGRTTPQPGLKEFGSTSSMVKGYTFNSPVTGEAVHGRWFSLESGRQERRVLVVVLDDERHIVL